MLKPRPINNNRPLPVWLSIVLLAAVAVTVAWHFLMLAKPIGHFSLSFVVNNIEHLVVISMCVLAGAGLWLRIAWVKWLFVPFVIGTSLHLLLSLPLLTDLDIYSDPESADALYLVSISYKLKESVWAILYLCLALWVTSTAFTYLKRG